MVHRDKSSRILFGQGTRNISRKEVENMATKKQDTAKKKASEIAAQAKAAKKAAPKAEPKKEGKVEEAKEEKVAKTARKTVDDKINEKANTASDTEKKMEVTPETAKAFAASSDDNDMFFRRTINVPGRRAVKKAFETEEIIGDDYDEVMTEGKQRQLEYQMLADSAKAKRPKRLTGRVRGVEPKYGPNGEIITYEAHVSLIMHPEDKEVRELMKKKEKPASIYTICIPAPMFFFFRRPEMFEGEDGLKNLHRVMKNKIGSIIEFVVYDVSLDNNKVIGSRVRAMQLKAYEYYLDPRNKKIKVGSKCAANITEVGVSGITVEICGAECFIQNSELSWLRISAASDEKEFKVGNKIKAVIKSIEVGKVDVYGRPVQFVAITASVKEAYYKPITAFGGEYPDGKICSGKVSYHLTNGKYFVRIDDRIDCICYPPDFATPYIGDDCSVIITGRNELGLKGDFTYVK